MVISVVGIDDKAGKQGFESNSTTSQLWNLGQVIYLLCTFIYEMDHPNDECLVRAGGQQGLSKGQLLASQQTQCSKCGQRASCIDVTWELIED